MYFYYLTVSIVYLKQRMKQEPSPCIILHTHTTEVCLVHLINVVSAQINKAREPRMRNNASNRNVMAKSSSLNKEIDKQHHFYAN